MTRFAVLRPNCAKGCFEHASLLEIVSLISNNIFFVSANSLYANVPSWNGWIVGRLYLPSKQFPIPVDYLWELIICTHSIRFDFEGIAHRQIDGVAMSILLGSTLVDVFLPMIEAKLNDHIFKPISCQQYVDTILFFLLTSQVLPIFWIPVTPHTLTFQVLMKKRPTVVLIF